MTSPSRRQTLALGLGAGLGSSVLGMVSGPAAARGPDVDFTLLLVNDIYRMGALDGRGGFPKLAALVKAERAKGHPVLVCHAGDTLSPSLMSGIDKGRHIIELTNLIKPDVFVPGNHEFDFGQDIYLERMRAANFPVFAANLRRADGTPVPGTSDSTILTLGGIKVGVVGLALPETQAKSQSGDWAFGPALATLAREATALRGAGAEMVLAVTHTDRATDEALVASRLADIVLSGHDHDLALRYDGRTVFAESGHDAEYVTAIDVKAEGSGKALTWSAAFRIHDTAEVEPDSEVEAVVRRLEGDLARELDVPLGRVTNALDTRTGAVRQGESVFGSLVADALRKQAEAEIGLMNGGGIRGNRLYPAGAELTRRDVLTELPFGNTSVLVKVSGATVLAALENGFSEIGRPAGRFPQVSGLAVTVETGRPAGKRVTAVTVGDAPLDPARTYTVAANNFMLAGGNDYGMLAEGRTLVGATDGTLVANVVMSYIRANAPLTIETGRLTIR
ncbi:bifunctional metallophosphatase/5'-nucleotidase [Methylobacterium nonmethylotrophicum]|uniref:Bifunctional metallophosphatase/5'-nucleotidase n=1 Tax=Methylobacterium nonmethylotrophicum TaxID=1141884 RepID=A0A4Z0NK15_9HYPH|nr:bifunctional UDP-sugar hydrolase/5'-nucleotidase [Methylobacterium nonmethylotrophicum]TGD95959.1 bifunctional metallophosphatase/5'-nucleotidase [Methylobacterium nonmethylotrophicum]